MKVFGTACVCCLKSPISASVGSRRAWSIRIRTRSVVAGDLRRDSRLKPMVVRSSRVSAAFHCDPSHTSKEKDSIRWPRRSRASWSEITSNVAGEGNFSVSSAVVFPWAASHQVSRFPSSASDGLFAVLDESAVSVPPAARFFAKVSRITRDDRFKEASWLSGINPRVSGERFSSQTPLRPTDW